MAVSSTGADGASLASFTPGRDGGPADGPETAGAGNDLPRITAVPAAPDCSRPSTGAPGDEAGATIDVDGLLPGVVRIATPAGTASGFVIDESGLIVTGRPVAENSGLLAVELSTGQTLSGRVAGVHEAAGLAFIEVRSDVKLTPLAVGDQGGVCAGDRVFSIGYSKESNGDSDAPAVAEGRVQIVGERYIRTDARLPAGSNGGPLLNADGRVVGVNAGGIMVGDGRPMPGVNFAVPVNEAILSEGPQLEPVVSARSGSLANQPASTMQPTIAPAPTPVPARLPEPTPRPTAAVVPQVTATPVLLPTPTATPPPLPTATPRQTAAPTPRPTATPRPTSTRRPTPTRGPTRVPRPTAKPTAIPAPSPTPLAVTGFYNNSVVGYEIEHPAHWRVQTDNAENVVSSAGSGGASQEGSYIEILTEDVLSEWSLGEYVESHRHRVTRRASSWLHYEQVSITGEFRDNTNYVHWEYTRQKEAGDCIESVVTNLYRSRYFPSRQKGFAVTMSICEEELDRYGPVREAILASFREFQDE